VHSSARRVCKEIRRKQTIHFAKVTEGGLEYTGFRGYVFKKNLKQTFCDDSASRTHLHSGVHVDPEVGPEVRRQPLEELSLRLAEGAGTRVLLRRVVVLRGGGATDERQSHQESGSKSHQQVSSHI
jgi:hypothetical protein